MTSTLTHPARRHRVVQAGLAALILLSAGCASVGAPKQTITLDKAMSLQTQADGTQSWKSAQLARYAVIHVDPSAVRFGPDVQLDAEQRQGLQQALTAALTEQFKAAGLLPAKAAATGPALKLDATVTSVQVTQPAVNVLTSLLLLGPLSRGGLTIELQAVDADTGQAMAALAFAGQAGVADISTAFSSTGHAALQAQAVAQRFVALFDRQAGASTARTL